MKALLIYILLLTPLLLFGQSAVDSLHKLRDSGRAETIAGHFAAAEQLLTAALNGYRSIHYDTLKYVCDDLSVLYRRKGEFEKQVAYTLQTITSMEATHDSSDINDYYYDLGVQYMNLGRFDNSLQWAEKCVGINERRHDSVNICLGSLLSVSALISAGKAAIALDYIHTHLSRIRPLGIKALSAWNEAYGTTYDALHEYDKAEPYIQNMLRWAWEYNRTESDPEKVARNKLHYYKSATIFYLHSRQFGKAAALVDTLMHIPPILVSSSMKVKLPLLKFQLDSTTGHYTDAILDYEAYKAMTDSVYTTQRLRQVTDLEMHFQTAQKDRDLAIGQSRQQLLAEELQQSRMTRNYTYALLVLILLLAAVGYTRYRANQRHNRELAKLIGEKDHLLAEKDGLLRDKEWLIREVHHRVKNNLQIVMSLLNSHSNSLQDANARTVIRESQHRVHAISLIHQKLYQSDSLSVIYMPSYIKDFIEHVSDHFDSASHIRFNLFVGPVYLDVAQAVPLGLIINEAVTNALKYAFPNQRPGSISISMQSGPKNDLTVLVSDTGIGVRQDFDPENHPSLGMNLMRGLCKQMDGRFRLYVNNGTHVEIQFTQKKSLVYGEENIDRRG
jgi:two-component system, sensor histidine kinase PdtaS